MCIFVAASYAVPVADNEGQPTGKLNESPIVALDEETASDDLETAEHRHHGWGRHWGGGYGGYGGGFYPYYGYSYGYPYRRGWGHHRRYWG